MDDNLLSKLRKVAERLEAEGLTKSAASVRLAIICSQHGSSIVIHEKQERAS